MENDTNPTPEIPSIGPATRPGPYLEDVVHTLQVARNLLDHAWDLCSLLDAKLELGTTAEDMDVHLAGALVELNNALALINWAARKQAS